MTSENKELEVDEELMLDQELVLEGEELILLPPITLANGKQERNQFMLIIRQPAVEHRLQKLFNINPKTWTELKDKGILPRNGSYEEILVALFNHYKNRIDARRTEFSINKESDGSSDTSSLTSNKIFVAEKIQKIRLDKAREQEVHLKNLATRNELISKEEEFKLIAPLLGNIANILRSAADASPELQSIIDNCFVNLHAVGEKLIKQAVDDREHYVQYMLDTPVDLDAIVQSAELLI